MPGMLRVRSGGTWVDVPVQGPQGPAGATGAQGPKGDTGNTGSQGPQGTPGAPGLVIGFADLPQVAPAGSISSNIGCDYGYTTSGVPANTLHTIVYTKQQAGSKILIRGSAGVWGTGSAGRVQIQIACYWHPEYTNRTDKALFMQYFNELVTWKFLAGHCVFTGLSARTYAFRLMLQNFVVGGPTMNCGTDATAGFTLEEVV